MDLLKNKLHHIKDNSIITFIASDFDNTEKTDTNKKLLIDAFNNIGINFKCEYLVDKRVSKDEAKELLNKSDIVFLWVEILIKK